MLTKLLQNVTTVVTGPAVKLRTDRSRDEVLIQVDIIGGSATVELQGRIGKEFQWIVLTTITSSSIIPVTRVAEVCARVSSVSGATINAGVHLDA